MSSPAPPSPSKRILRTIVTGAPPTDSKTHADRWGMPNGQETNIRTASGATGVGGARVRGLVDEYERSFSSKPYSAMPQAASSPIKTNFASSPTSVGRNIPVLTSTQAPQRPPTSTPNPRSPTTVPASFFQMQQARRTPPASPTSAKLLLESPIGKENQPRLAFQPSPRPQPSPLPQRALTSIAYIPPASASSGSSDVSTALSGLSGLTLETMATRSSGSTHTTESASNSASGPSLRIASTVEPRDSATARTVPANEMLYTARPAVPQILQVGPTPRRQAVPTPITAPAVLSPSGVPAPSPPLPPRSPCGSSFVEALPASYPSRSPTTSPLPGLLANASSTYMPLPLDNPLPSPKPNQAQQAARPRPRARASTLGSGLKPSFASESLKVETADEKRARVEEAFDKLLDTMELPDRSVRTKMQGLAFPLKEEMLRSAANSTGSPTSTASSRPRHQRGKSFTSSDFPPSNIAVSATGSTKKESGFKSTFLRKTKSNQSLRASTSNGVSADASKSSHSRNTSAASILFRSFGKSAGAAVSKEGPIEGEDAAWWAENLRSLPCSQLSVKELGRLRGRLRNEAPGWVNSFIEAGGYNGMLERLKELLEMEWREEQHDDQVLHELLRAFKALTLTACGKRALASHYPTPFLPIASLLFSEKRPGDLPCRQILVELILAVFDICPIDADTLPKSAWSSAEVSLVPASHSPSPPSSSLFSPSAPGSGIRRYQRKIKSSDSDSDSIEREEVLTSERILSTHRFLISLMEGPPDEKEEAKVDFIKQSHRPRIFKTWVTEIADCVRDYFWIFCHSQNLFWTFEQLDVDAIEAPKVPSGMTGGVEYEAMAYATAHLRLINAIARTCPTVEAAFAFHDNLFQSGFERVLFTLRRASLVYYQSLHLEMSRYISLARSARFNLGPRILSCLDRRFLRQEELMVVHMMEQREHQTRSGAPQIGAVM
ncbi:uncharacterized protein JCM15063_004674 [Sporobolomyces koalae]|uniref:uncharacterized protein n=1 Tax=Sporobolomyces koalae TaxID=500713 RepID=UPI00316C70AD